MTQSISRRRFARWAAATPLAALWGSSGVSAAARTSSVSSASKVAAAARFEQTDYAGGLTDLKGIRVGHYTESRRPTGCTVVLCEAGAVASVSIRGAAPGTRETALLDPVNAVQKIHAVVLSGGSAYGLDTASGVMRYLEEKGVGFKLAGKVVPIVPAAILFDLPVGRGDVRPGPKEGYQACRNALPAMVQEGNLGAGTGATVGKLLGRERAMKGGIGSVSLKVGDLTVAALAAVNCAGDVRDPESGKLLAGARKARRSGELADAAAILRTRKVDSSGQLGQNTTLAVVAVNASLSKTQARWVAHVAHDGLARAINPSHTPIDGDTVFVLSVGGVTDFDIGQVGHLAAEACSRAIARGVTTCWGIRGYPSHADLARMSRRG